MLALRLIKSSLDDDMAVAAGAGADRVHLRAAVAVFRLGRAHRQRPGPLSKKEYIYVKSLYFVFAYFVFLIFVFFVIVY